MRKMLLPFMGLIAIVGCKQEPAAIAPPVPVTASIKAEVPLFTLPTPTDEKLALADQLSSHKVVLVNFWFHA